MNISNSEVTFKDLFTPHQGNDFKPRFLQSNILLYVVIGILALKIFSVVVYLPVPYNWFFADVTKTDLVNLLNQNRQSLGLGILTENQKLDEAAQLKAQDMVAKGYFSHQSPAGTTPWFWFKQAGYNYKYAGENLAVGFVDSSTVYDAWSNSPSHKENLLNKNYTEIGTAVVTGFGGDSTLIVQLFGRPLTKATSVPVVSKPVAVPVELSAQTVAEEPLQETVSSNVIPKVLSGSTEQIVGPEYAGKRSFYLQVLNFVIYDNGAILQYVSLALLAIILLCLGINGILMFRVENRAMLLRPVGLAVILGIAIFLNKDIASHLLPYQVII